MPRLDLQVQDWTKLDPKLRRVGLIVSQSHTDLISQAQLAAKIATVSFKSEISGSDRETLYLFKRMAPHIDGIWLVPDDQILSPGTLRNLLEYAVSHGVRVCVFSDALLDWGALMSARPTTPDTARTLRRLLERMMAEIAACEESETRSSALCFVDLDQFKYINEPADTLPVIRCCDSLQTSCGLRFEARMSSRGLGVTSLSSWCGMFRAVRQGK
jgi:hypothetical protein